MAGHLSTAPFTASHCPDRDITVPLSESYCTYHVVDSTCTAAFGLLLVAGPSALNTLLDPVCNPNATEAAFRRLLALGYFQFDLTGRLFGIIVSTARTLRVNKEVSACTQ